ncbi:MAG: adenine glycosylase [Coriobacteriia bacterium]|nr:adenine glycosylase [Coriobacteriia bacterium]
MTTRLTQTPIAASGLAEFVTRVAEAGVELYRDFPWRRTTDPYEVLVSEVMLQQTQVSRVEKRFEEWLAEFPTIDALAQAPLEPVLRAWQGLGYNRRAVALKRAAEQTAERFGGTLPADDAELRSLPGIGPATAAGVLAFAYDKPARYLETNVRAVFLHELFGDRDGVSDREIEPLVSAAVEEAGRQGVGPRAWYYALLDYGAHLKRSLPNPSRRSAHHTRQSRFEGSRRQKRAWLLRAVMEESGLSAEEYGRDLGRAERDAGRDAPDVGDVSAILDDLVADGFLAREGDRWFVR